MWECVFVSVYISVCVRLFASACGCVQKVLLDPNWQITYKSQFPIQTHGNYSRRSNLAGKTAEVDELSVTFDLGGSE